MRAAAMPVATSSTSRPGIESSRPTSQNAPPNGTAWRHDDQAAERGADSDRHHHQRRPGDVLGARRRPSLDAAQAEGRGFEDVVRQRRRCIAGDTAVLHHHVDPAHDRPVLLPHVLLHIEIGMLGQIAGDIGGDQRRKPVRRSPGQRLSRSRDDVGEQQALEDEQPDDEREEAKADAPVQRAIPAQIRGSGSWLPWAVRPRSRSSTSPCSRRPDCRRRWPVRRRPRRRTRCRGHWSSSSGRARRRRPTHRPQPTRSPGTRPASPSRWRR